MKNKFKREKAYLGIIDKFIIFFVTIAVVLVISTSIISYNRMEDNLLDVYENSLSNRVEELVESFDSFFENKFDNLYFLATQPEVYNMNRNEQQEYLLEKAKLLGFEKLFIVDEEGKAFYIKQNIVKNQAGEDFTKKVLNNDRYISEPFMEYTLHRSITTISVDIVNADGKKVGALCGTIDLAKVNYKIEEFTVGKDGFGVMINDAGQYIAYKDMSLVHSKENFIDEYSEYNDDISLIEDRDDIRENSGSVKLKGIKYSAAYKKLDVNEWTVIILVPQSEVLVELGEYTRMQVLNVMVVVLLILLVAKIMYNWLYNEHKAYTDGLTKIFNRAKCDLVLKKIDKDNKSRIILICFDLNNFKKINDLEGHAAGDKMLQDFAKILNNVFGKIGLVSRIGGDEFLVLLKNATDKEIEDCIHTMNRRIDLYNRHFYDNKKLKLSTAYGIAIKERNELTSVNILKKRADSEMYKNKYKDK